MEAKQKESAGGDALDRLIAQASAFATADPTKGFGYAAGVSATASQALKKEQDVIRKQEEMTMAKLYSEFDKEDDARKRGDSKGMLDAQQKIKDHNDKLAELANQNIIARSGQANALTNATQAANATFLALFEKDKIKAMQDQAMASLKHANAAEAQVNKEPEQITFTKLYGSDPRFAEAVDAIAKGKIDPKNEQTTKKEYTDKIMPNQILFDRFPTFESYKKFVDSASRDGENFNPSNYPPVYTDPKNGNVYTMTPNGRYVLTTSGEKK